MEIIYGRHAVLETVRAGKRRINRVFISDRLELGQPVVSALVAEAARHGISVERIAAGRLDALTRVGNHHHGVAAEVSAFTYAPLTALTELVSEQGGQAFVLFLDSIQDPQNFGTLLRSAEGVGVTGVVMLDRRQVEVTPAVVNASAGAVEHLRIALATNLPRAIGILQDAGLWIYALEAEPGALRYTEAHLGGPLGLVVGSEAKGVGRLVRERCDGALEIPMMGKIESLNAAVAGSVVLYEALRQRESART